MKSNKRYFITGIDTNIGKTICSAILTEALQADYWKPIQAGDLHHSDTDKVRNLVSNSSSVFHSNTFALKTPASPHYAAEIDGVNIELNDFKTPTTSRSLIIEGAGGLLVPINQQATLLDLLLQEQWEVIVVVKNYLGSINHTLLTLKTLHAYPQITCKGIIINGERNASSEQIKQKLGGLPILGYVPQCDSINKAFVKEQAMQFKFLAND